MEIEETEQRVRRLNRQYVDWTFSYTPGAKRPWRAQRILPLYHDEARLGMIPLLEASTLDQLLRDLGRQQRLHDEYLADILDRRNKTLGEGDNG